MTRLSTTFGLGEVRSILLRRVLAAALVAGLLAACATHDPSASIRQPAGGVEEYRQLASASTVAVLEALRSLEQVSGQSDRCPPKIVDAFAAEVEQLQVRSLKVRARAQAIQARGDAYFEAWAKTGSSEGSSSVPAYAPELRDSFARTKLASRQAGDAFRSFLSGLRTLRGDLMTNAEAIKTEKARELIRATREHGWHVLQKLSALTDELQALDRLLVREKPDARV